jgi:hypothetical protein
VGKAEREARGKAVRRRLTDQERLWRSVPESQVLHSVLDYAARLGGYGYRQNSGAVVSEYKGKRRFIRYGEPGASDTVLIIGGVVIFCECKDELGRQSPEQQAWQAAIEQAGGRYVVVRPSNWEQVLSEAIGYDTQSQDRW